ncbi:MAG: aspartate aminotransferase family protein [Chloroflexi bacterium]|nr:aspartate aminotransferase family protein [Chloroflexota bacterium]
MTTSSASSEAIFDLAARYIPGGVNSNTRTYPRPLAFARAQGAYIYEADGTSYLDYHAAFGPPVLGHCNPEVNSAVAEVMDTLDLVGIGTTELEARAAAKIVQHVPSAEQVLFCNSGSEATYSAVRLARGVTGRRKLVKFQGCYHGWHDSVLMNVISPREKIGTRDVGSIGLLDQAIEDTYVLRFNDVEALEALFAEKGDEIAAVILEPIPHNIGAVLPEDAFLQALRRLTAAHGSVLIFDEVITGFRHHVGGYQAICGITPDLTTMGKAMANGFPVAALAGRRDLMQRFQTAGGDVFFGGTYNAHPIAMAATLATIEALEDGSVHRRLFRLGDRMRSGLQASIDRLGLPAHATGFGSVFVVYWTPNRPVRSYEDLLESDGARYVAFHTAMIERGFFMLPLNLKRNHLSAAHTEADVDRTLEAADAVLQTMAA